MTDVSQAQIVIRHISGSKTNQVEQIPLKDLREITFGRDPTATIAFDQRRDDVVSRRHAQIRVEGGDNPIFRICDLGSSNGTFLNGAPISGEVELAPDDIVELGKGGPRFSFDVQPRPASWASRTRVVDALDSTVTRAVAAVSADGGATAERAAFSGAEDATQMTPAVPPKIGVGKDTVLHMLSQQRKSTSRVWMASLAAVLLVLCVVGYGLYRHSLMVTTTELAERTEAIQSNANRMVAQKLGALGMSAKDIDDRFGNTVVYIELQWRLFDQATGKPVFQKVVKTKNGLYPAFVKQGDNYYRWLTLEDDDRLNLPIQDAGHGSGFVVGGQGFILTNKHVAAGWMIPYKDLGDSEGYRNGFVYTYGSKKIVGESVPLSSDVFGKLKDWIPGDGAPVFSADNASYLGGENDSKHVFSGRDEILSVRFPGNRMGMQASLVRASTDADVALVKIDAAQTLKTVELASSADQVQVGDRVMALGYPAVSAETKVIMPTIQGNHVENVDEDIPEPTMTEGIIQRLGTHLHREGEATVYGTLDDAIQLSINATGPGNSGGPVFDDKGHVIGLLTYMSGGGQGGIVTYAVPIKHGLDLMQPQQAGAN